MELMAVGSAEPDESGYYERFVVTPFMELMIL
jgi:hypothetical protein